MPCDVSRTESNRPARHSAHAEGSGDSDGHGAWKEIGRGQTVGHKRILRFAPVTARKLRLDIEDARARPTVTTFGVFRSPG